MIELLFGYLALGYSYFAMASIVLGPLMLVAWLIIRFKTDNKYKHLRTILLLSILITLLGSYFVADFIYFFPARKAKEAKERTSETGS